MTSETDIKEVVEFILEKKWERNIQKVPFMIAKSQDIGVTDKDRDLVNFCVAEVISLPHHLTETHMGREIPPICVRECVPRPPSLYLKLRREPNPTYIAFPIHTRL
jgi:hypothetical protein